MNSVKTLIAAAAIIFVSNVLSGCDFNKPSEEAVNRIQSYQEMKKSLTLRVEQQLSVSQVTMTLFLDNPEKKPIASVQSWLSYNPKALKGNSINTEKSSFDLAAPYKNEFDSNQGILKLGAAATTPANDAVLQVAQVTFDLMEKGTTMVDAYDYRNELSGHVSANVLIDGTPYNLLLKPTSPLMVIQH